MEKRYYSLDNFYKNKFGSKVFKVSLDAGFTCPNKDGVKVFGGCIFCNSSPGIGKSEDEIILQFEKVKSVLHKKWPEAKYIPFLEANTNTYADVETLKSIYEPLLQIPNVVGLNIATRCDAISDSVYDYLEELASRTFLTVELGLQSSHDQTLIFLNRGHTRDEFIECVKKLKRLNINVVVHVINGIPGETEDMMLETIKFINSLNVDGIKFHMLYIEEGTKLAQLYRKEQFKLLSRDEYIRILGQQISMLNENIVVHRLCSGPDNKKLIEPRWLLGKFSILNEIERYFIDNDIYQNNKKEN